MTITLSAALILALAICVIILAVLYIARLPAHNNLLAVCLILLALAILFMRL